MTETTQKAKFGRPYYILTCVNALVSISFYMINPILTKYLTDIGVALQLASVIAGLFSITALCIRPFTGILADRLNPKRILSVSIPLLGASMALYSFTTSVPMIVVIRIINGIAFSLNGTVMIAYASLYIPKERMGEGVGYLGLGQIVASAVGPTLGVSIGETMGYRTIFLTSFAIAAVGFLLLLCIREPVPQPSGGASLTQIRFSDIIAAELIPIAFLSGLFSFSNGMITNFLVLSSEARGIEGCSLYFTVLAVFLFVLRPMAGRLSDKYGLTWILVPAYLCTAVGVIIIAHAPNLYLILFAAAFMAFGQGGGQPAIQAQCVKQLGPGRRGLATSTYYIFADIFQGTGPMIGGAVAERYGYTANFYLTAAVLLAGLFLFLLLQSVRKKNGLLPY